MKMKNMSDHTSNDDFSRPSYLPKKVVAFSKINQAGRKAVGLYAYIIYVTDVGQVISF